MFKSTIPGSLHKAAHVTSRWLHEMDVIIPRYRRRTEAQKVNQKENGIKVMPTALKFSRF